MGLSTSRVQSLSSTAFDVIRLGKKQSSKTYTMNAAEREVKRSQTMKTDTSNKSYHLVFMERLEKRRNEKSFDINKYVTITEDDGLQKWDHLIGSETMRELKNV